MHGSRRHVMIIYGSGSGSGKTTLAVGLLGMLKGWAAMKITPSPLFTAVRVEDRDTAPPGKDTWLMARAGAEPVIHLRASEEDLEEGISQAASLVPPGRSLLIEGRGALPCLEPDLSILVWRPGLAAAKAPAGELARTADMVFINREEGEETAEEEDLRRRYGGKVITTSLRHGLGEAAAGELMAILRARGIC